MTELVENSDGGLDRPGSTDSGQPPREVVSVAASTWEGPLPSPEYFRRYEEILPGVANRILEMAEKQQAHNHYQERTSLENERILLETARAVVEGNSNRSKWGLVFAFLVAIIGIVIGGWLTYLGKGGYGLTFVFAPLVSLVGVFVYQSNIRRTERQHGVEEVNQ